MTEFRQATDTLAVRLKAEAENPSDSLMSALAHQWLQKTR